MKLHLTLFVLVLSVLPSAAKHPSFSGIYPHLSFFNNEKECGTGSVVPFADRLWVVRTQTLKK